MDVNRLAACGKVRVSRCDTTIDNVKRHEIVADCAKLAFSIVVEVEDGRTVATHVVISLSASVSSECKAKHL
jgi:hypothetical protein